MTKKQRRDAYKYAIDHVERHGGICFSLFKITKEMPVPAYAPYYYPEFRLFLPNGSLLSSTFWDNTGVRPYEKNKIRVIILLFCIEMTK